MTKEKVVSFTDKKEQYERSLDGLTKYYAAGFKKEWIDEGDLKFIDYLKSNFDTDSKMEYVTITFSKLIIRMKEYKRLQDSIAENVGNGEIIFTKDFKLCGNLYKKNTYLNQVAGDLLASFDLMFNINGSIEVNKFLTNFICIHKIDPVNNIFKQIKAEGHERKGIVEDFVENYIGYTDKNSDEYKLSKSNIIRLFKQIYFKINLSSKVPVQEYKNPYSQAFFLTGFQGAGKTSFIEGMSFNLFSNHTSFQDPMHPQLRANCLVYLADEMGAIRTKRGNESWKADVSASILSANIKYEKSAKLFPARSTWVIATNEKNILTDTTSASSNRRAMIIPFKDKGNSEDFIKKIKKFWSTRCDNAEGKSIKGDLLYDTKQYYMDMWYTIIFTDEYADTEIDINYNEEIKKINNNFASESQYMSDARTEIAEFCAGYIAIADGNWKYSKTSQRKSSILGARATTEAQFMDNQSDSYTAHETDTFGEDYTSYSQKDKVIKVKDLPCIFLTDLTMLLREDKVKYYGNQEIVDAMTSLGYTMKDLNRRTIFVLE
jgi:hypothetical protein